MFLIKVFTLFISINIYSFDLTYSEINKALEQAHNQHPHRTKLFTLTLNDQDVPVNGITISPPMSLIQDNEYSEAVVVATHHGNEVGSTDVAMGIIEELLTSPEVIQNKIIHIIPVLNISGFNIKRREEFSTRDQTWYDPNRDYPDPCDLDKLNYKLSSTKALAELIKSNSSISSAITIHGYVGTFTFPWGTYHTDTHTHDHQEFINLTSEAAQINDYQIGTHADVIYPAIGAFEDWTYWELGVWSTLLEVDWSYDRKKDSLSAIKYLELSPNTRSEARFYNSSDLCKNAKLNSTRP